MKMKIFILIIAIFLLISGFASAQNLAVSLDKTTYGLDEKVLVTSIVANEGDNPVEWIFEGELYSNNPEVTIPRNFVKYLKLNSGESETVSFELSTDSIMFDGTYEVRTRILSSDYEILTKDSASFILAGALKPLHVNILFSKDKLSIEKSKIFFESEEIFVNYDADVEDTEVQAILTYPDKTKKELTLPASITADQIGTYELKIIVSKKGYPTVTKTSQFAVVRKDAGSINSISKCNANNVCESSENYKTCPQDCNRVISKEVRFGLVGVLVLILILLLVKRKKIISGIGKITKKK